MHQFASAGIALCCVTNKESRFALPLLEAAQLDTLLAFTLCADRSTDRKPSPDMPARMRALVLLSSPAELLYVGDSAIDVVAAHSAGCRVVAVDYGYGDKAICRASQAALASSEISGATPDVHATAPCAPFFRRRTSHGERDYDS